eukprot:3648043-Prymnesium_polylepis.1
MTNFDEIRRRLNLSKRHRVCVINGLQHAAHEHDTRARGANDASGVRPGPGLGEAGSRPLMAPARPSVPCSG